MSEREKDPFGMQLDNLLRYGLSGGAGFLALLSVNKPLRSLLASILSTTTPLSTGNLLTSLGIVTAGSLLIGSLIYSIHRAITLPVLDLIVQQLIRLVFHVRISRYESQIQSDLRRWRTASSDDLLNYSHDPLTGWASQIHLLYCTALAIVLFTSPPFQDPSPTVVPLLNFFAIVLTASAFISQLRRDFYQAVIQRAGEHNPEWNRSVVVHCMFWVGAVMVLMGCILYLYVPNQTAHIFRSAVHAITIPARPFSIEGY